MTAPPPPGLSEPAFLAVTRRFHDITGIRLGPDKRHLVEGRLRRLFPSPDASLDLAAQRLLDPTQPGATDILVDALVTNETQFFREAQHFEFLAQHLARHAGGPYRVWSAACSSGEEAYTLAMVLASRWPHDAHSPLAPAGPGGRTPGAPLVDWSVLGTDVSHTMVHRARRGVYPLSRATGIPTDGLRRFALKGEGPSQGWLLMAPALRERVRFEVFNLNRPPSAQTPWPGPFDCVFLRNMLIYFDDEARTRIVRRVLDTLAPGGLLMTGHAESLTGLGLPLRLLAPAVYTLA